MKELTARERVKNLLERKPADRSAFMESIWPETVARWIDQGFLKKDEDLSVHFNMEFRGSWPFNCIANLDVPVTVIEEDEETKLVRNGNGALLRWWKKKSGTPEHVDFMVKDRVLLIRSSDARSMATISRDARIPMSGTSEAIEKPQQSQTMEIFIN